MLLRNAVEFSWQDGEYPGSWSTRTSAEKDVDELMQRSGAVEKQWRGRLNEDNVDPNPPCSLIKAPASAFNHSWCQFR